MRTLLSSALFAVALVTSGFGLAGMSSASTLIGTGTINKGVTNFSPRVQLATHECRVVTVCDKNGKNCENVDKCR
jgi:hypothetical protein